MATPYSDQDSRSRGDFGSPPTSDPGRAELSLISDFPIDDAQLAQIRLLHVASTNEESCMIKSAASRIRDLVVAKLNGCKIDVVAFMDELLDLAKETGAIRCSPASEGSLRFEMADRETCEVEVDAYRGKLRMLCARLHVLADQPGTSGLSPYGGEGVVRKPRAAQTGNGTALPSELAQWTIRFKNTPDKQEFTIAPIQDQRARRASFLDEHPAATSSTR